MSEICLNLPQIVLLYSETEQIVEAYDQPALERNTKAVLIKRKHTGNALLC